jgi:hypothetical protein
MAKIFGNLERASLEVLSSAPTVGVTGRVYWDSTLLKAQIDNSVAFRAFLVNDGKCILGNSGTAAENIRLHRGAAGVLQLVSGADATAEGSLSTALNQLSARVENYTTGSLPAAANAGRLLWDTSVSFLKVDTGAAIKTLVTTDGVQTLSGKTFSDAITGDQIATPSNPAAGKNKLYFKADEKLYSLTSGGTETQVGASPSALAVTSKTANYTATGTDDVILVDSSGGDFTITLPAAASNSGKVFYIKKTNTGCADKVTIDGNASETIDGATTTTVNTEGETLVIVCDGSNWKIIERRIPSVWTAYTPDWTGSVTNPTIGNGTLEGWWRRVGDSIEIQVNMKVGSTSTIAAGDLYYATPTGATVDTSKVAGWSDGLIVAGRCEVLDAGTLVYVGHLTMFDSTRFALQIERVNGTDNQVSAGYYGGTNPFSMTTNDQHVFHTFHIPISGWNS